MSTPEAMPCMSRRTVALGFICAAIVPSEVYARGSVARRARRREARRLAAEARWKAENAWLRRWGVSRSQVDGVHSLAHRFTSEGRSPVQKSVGTAIAFAPFAAIAALFAVVVGLGALIINDVVRGRL